MDEQRIEEYRRLRHEGMEQEEALRAVTRGLALDPGDRAYIRQVLEKIFLPE